MNEHIHYTSARNAQIVIYLLKKHGIKKVIASPGTQNMSLVTSMNHDPWFEMYSAPDERSAAYMACGLSAESGEPVVLSCTGATASRNYVPGLTEAFYRHLPIVAITSTEIVSRVGHNVAQVIDRSSMQPDIAKISVRACKVTNPDDEQDCIIQVNKALLELNHHGKGPVHINLEKTNDLDFSVEELPSCRFIQRFCKGDKLPEIPEDKRVAIFVGSHVAFTEEETKAIDAFCGLYDSVVFCDQTSNYHSKYRVQFSLVASQDWYSSPMFNTDILIQLGGISGDYYQSGKLGSNTKEVWRIDADGELKDSTKKLYYVFEMNDLDFFCHYVNGNAESSKTQYLEACIAAEKRIRVKFPELPFSNIWVAQQLAPMMPKNCYLHFGILNSLRSWNFFDVDSSINGYSNVGGFGIDGGVSSLIGSSFAHKDILHFGIFGDLAFFYDMNSLGNRHVGNNLRILLVNNAVGSEFKLSQHPASRLGDETEQFIAAGGHYGHKSPDLIRHYAEDLGFEYMKAETKEQLKEVADRFTSPEMFPKPILLEVFTEAKNEDEALMTLKCLERSESSKIKETIRNVIGEKATSVISKILR